MGSILNVGDKDGDDEEGLLFLFGRTLGTSQFDESGHAIVQTKLIFFHQSHSIWIEIPRLGAALADLSDWSL